MALTSTGVAAASGPDPQRQPAHTPPGGASVTATYSDAAGKIQWEPLQATRFGLQTDGESDASVTVDPSKTFQHYSGVGISIDETGVSNLWKLSRSEREAAIKKLVSPTQGAGLDQFRLTIGTPDTIEHMPFTSYDEMPKGRQDWNLTHFSLKHDFDYHIVETVKLIQKYNPRATFFASAWSAPGWMKTNGKFAGEIAKKPGSTDYYQVGKLRDDCIDVFARYYAKYIRSYAALGVPIQAITLLNEPGMDVVYPAMDLSIAQQQKLALAVKKEFKRSHIGTELWVHDFNFWDWKNPNSTATKNYYRIFEDSPDGTVKGSDVMAAADGVAFHPYWGEPTVMGDAYRQTGKSIHMTESGGIDAGTILEYMREDAGTYNAWTQITDQDGGTLHWTDARDNNLDWDQVARTSKWKDRLVTVNTNTGSVSYDAGLGGIGQVSRYLDQSDVRVQSSGTSKGISNVVYRDAGSRGDSDYVAVIRNTNTTSTRTRVAIGNRSFAATIPAGSTATFRWKAPTTAGPQVTTANGTMQGATTLAPGSDKGADSFLKVPFAAPPVGELRWKAPQAPADWAGVRDATTPSPLCPQGADGQEDCLYLDVYRPAGTSSRDRLPVMVWAYGGGNTGGGAKNIDGRRMAAENNMVVVVPNYRLGALGFLDMGRKGSPSGNYGVQDIRAALQWTQRNIAGFGGNPRGVTLSGQSSGGTNACRLLVDPSTRGLYSAMTINSDDCLHDVDTPAEATGRATALAQQLGCDTASDSLACLRARSAKELAAAGGTWNPVAATPAVDLIKAGRFNRVPMLMGSNKAEGRLFTPWYDFDADQYKAWVSDLVGPAQAPRVLEQYPADRYSGQWAIQYVMADVMTDSGMRGLGGYTGLRAAGALAARTPTYMYEFQDMGAPSSGDPKGFVYGAAHGAEVQYLFPNEDTWGRFTTDQKRLSNEMSHYWGSFVRYHRPVSQGGAVWTPLRGERSGTVMQLRPGGSRSEPVPAYSREHRIDFWRTLPIIMARG